ncbi:hypothetical protein E4U41_007019 [Claviceps citrina]|nr:hypothetical protein E4U41_007019 [Claviceps citrina]
MKFLASVIAVVATVSSVEACQCIGATGVDQKVTESCCHGAGGSPDGNQCPADQISEYLSTFASCCLYFRTRSDCRCPIGCDGEELDAKAKRKGKTPPTDDEVALLKVPKEPCGWRMTDQPCNSRPGDGGDREQAMHSWLSEYRGTRISRDSTARNGVWQTTVNGILPARRVRKCTPGLSLLASVVPAALGVNPVATTVASGRRRDIGLVHRVHGRLRRQQDRPVTGTSRMVYDFAVTGVNGRVVHFHGYKAVSSSASCSPRQPWRSLTTLYVTVTE